MKSLELSYNPVILLVIGGGEIELGFDVFDP